MGPYSISTALVSMHGLIQMALRELKTRRSVSGSVGVCPLSGLLMHVQRPESFAASLLCEARHTVEGVSPCYMPEVDHPARTVPLSDELCEVSLCHPDDAHRRVKYIRREGFSAKLGANQFTYTFRVAF